MRRGGGKPFLIFYKNRPAISRAEITDTKKVPAQRPTPRVKISILYKFFVKFIIIVYFYKPLVINP